MHAERAARRTAERADALLRCAEHRRLRAERRVRDLGLARRRELAIEQVLLALGVDLGGLGLRAVREEAGLRLAELGAVDLGEHVAGLHLVALVLRGAADDAAEPRADGGDARGVEVDRAHDADRRDERRTADALRLDVGAGGERLGEDDRVAFARRDVAGRGLGGRGRLVGDEDVSAAGSEHSHRGRDEPDRLDPRGRARARAGPRS